VGRPLFSRAVYIIRKGIAVILVIDDEPGITELLTDILEFHGHPVMVAHSAEEALDLIQLQRPDAILVDLMMPSIDGLSLALTLRHMNRGREIPLVAMSASDSALALADRIGDFDAYIGKPFENDELVALVERLTRVAS
jgi:CheY-like chemotaxis protein